MRNAIDVKAVKCRKVCTLAYLLFLSLTICSTALAQPDHERVNYAGKDFWLTQHRMAPANRCVFLISGAHNANITFSFTSPASTQSYFLQAGTVLKIQLTSAQVLSIGGVNLPVEIVWDNSLHISSDSDIVVQFTAAAYTDDDGTLLYPSDNQGYGEEYLLNGAIVHGSTSNVSNHGSFSIVSRCDSVVLEITPSFDTKLHTAGVPFTVTLNRGSTYIIGCAGTVRDLSGTKVRILYAKCCNPINIFATYAPTYQSWPPPPGPGLCCADRLVEQILPVNVWDTIHPVVQFRNNPYNVIKIVSASNNNIIYFDGNPVTTLNAGGRFDTFIKGAVVIKSSFPVSVSEYMIAQQQAYPAGNPPTDSMSDPDMLWVMPLRDGVREAYIRPLCYLANTLQPTSAPVEFNRLHVLTLISKASNANTVVLNNVNLGAQFIPFPNNPDYKYAYIKLDSSVTYHLLSNERIVAYYNGAYDAGSTSYAVGDIHPSDLIVSEVLTFEPDTLNICENSSATLIADPADAYLWSDGSTGNQITVSDSGLYYVHVRYNDSCGSGGTKVFRVNVDNYAQGEIRDTIYKCLNDTLTLTGPAGADRYEWTDGTGGQQIQVTTMGGAYSVTATFQAQCRQETNLFTILPPSYEQAVLHLGEDTTICRGDQLQLKGAGENTHWSTGYVGPAIIVREPGVYWASVYDSCFEVFTTDTISVRDTLCPKSFCTLVFPSAFSPNNDGRNDIFRPVYRGEFTGYYLTVYNRWGEKVYQSYDIDKGWDGMYKGVAVELGVYYYLCSYECTRDGNKMTKGEITVIR